MNRNKKGTKIPFNSNAFVKRYVHHFSIPHTDDRTFSLKTITNAE